jgi:FKBP-type peptidyl-prolyl cis-trans isomerase
MRFVVVIGLVLFFVFSGCNDNSGNGKVKRKYVPEKSLIKANRYLARTEKETIDNYIARHKLKMKSTGTGLRYMIIEHGNGPKAKKGDVAVIDYTVRLITGDVVYSSKQSGEKVFEIGRGGVESGLEEGILLLKKGDKAKFILPSHLAFGLHGDDNKIPPKMPIVYDVELKDLK